MPLTTQTFPWGKDKIELALPESWKIAGCLEPAPLVYESLIAYALSKASP